MAALYYTHKMMMQMEPCLADKQDSVAPCSDETEYLTASTTKTVEEPFGNHNTGIQVHLLWDMLESNQSRSSCGGVATNCRHALEMEFDDDATATVAPTLTDAEDDMQDDDDDESWASLMSDDEDDDDDFSLDDDEETVAPSLMNGDHVQTLSPANAVHVVRFSVSPKPC